MSNTRLQTETMTEAQASVLSAIFAALEGAGLEPRQRFSPLNQQKAIAALLFDGYSSVEVAPDGSWATSGNVSYCNEMLIHTTV